MEISWAVRSSILSYGTGKLLQKSHIIFAEEAYVINAILEERGTLDAHAECKTGVFIWIDTAILKHIGMYHSAAENLKPARVFANAAPLALAERATDVHFSARFGKRE